tara:strand:+ start:202 stop:654 length:453 start_codon:yes stop_codon:yes gene_type:complete
VDDSQYQRDIDSVEIYLVEDLDITVVFGKEESNAYWKPNGHACVSVATNQCKRLQLYSILHEAGHAIIRANENYGKLYPYGEDDKSNTIRRRVDVIREECAAWDVGAELADYLGIELDYKRYHNFYKKHLFEYVKWAYDPTTYEAEIGKP